MNVGCFFAFFLEFSGEESGFLQLLICFICGSGGTAVVLFFDNELFGFDDTFFT